MRQLRTGDREFLARISALNTVLGKIAFPIIEGTITVEQQRKLGAALVAIGEEFYRRADSYSEPDLNTVDSYVTVSSTQSSQHVINSSSALSLPQAPEQTTTALSTGCSV